MAATGKIMMLARMDPKAAKGKIIDAMTATDGNLTAAADVLGVHRNTLWKVVQELDMLPKLARLWPDRTRGGSPLHR